MTQYLLRKGLKKFKNVEETAVQKELNQLHTKNTFAPMNVANVVYIEKGYALELLIFPKEKCNRTFKVQACAGGQKK